MTKSGRNVPSSAELRPCWPKLRRRCAGVVPDVVEFGGRREENAPDIEHVWGNDVTCVRRPVRRRVIWRALFEHSFARLAGRRGGDVRMLELEGSWCTCRRLHLGVLPVLAWASGARHWTSMELHGLQTIQVWMTRRIAGEDETWPQFAQQATRWARNLLALAKVLAWDDAIATQWWRWAGHAARLIRREPTRCLASVLLWREAWWRKTLRALNHSDTDLGRLCLRRGHRRSGRRR